VKFLPDTNIISAILQENEAVIERFKHLQGQGHSFIISAINHYEITRGLVQPKFEKKLRRFNAFLTKVQIIMPDLETMNEAARIYQQLKHTGKPIEDADILIAACALQQQSVLVTDNVKHFSRIQNLYLENWIERT
jgi:tRNA(fMet)-specific endonuclease VapC